MIKSKKLKLARETVLVLSNHRLALAQGGVGATVGCNTRSVAPEACEPSGIRACDA